MLEEFGNVIAPGGAGVVIASQSGHRLGALTTEEDAALAITPSDELLALPMLQPDQVTDSLHAYQLSKRGNALRVMAEAVRWGKRGARVNTISPGIIITPLARDELTGPRGEGYRRMIEMCPAGRAGTPTSRNRRGAPDGTGRRLHYRQRLPHGQRSYRRLPLRRTGSEVARIDASSTRRGACLVPPQREPDGARNEQSSGAGEPRRDVDVLLHHCHLAGQITQCLLQLVGALGLVVLAACDLGDGLQGGLVDDPRIAARAQPKPPR